MRKKLIALVLGIGMIMATVPLFAHHAFSAEYDSSKVLTLKGKMVKFEWLNPHSWVHIEVTDAAGKKTIWKGETPPVNVLFRNGWTKPLAQSMVDKGEIVTLRGPAAKDGSNHLFSQGLTREDGVTVLGLSGAPPTN